MSGVERHARDPPLVSLVLNPQTATLTVASTYRIEKERVENAKLGALRLREVDAALRQSMESGALVLKLLFLRMNDISLTMPLITSWRLSAKETKLKDDARLNVANRLSLASLRMLGGMSITLKKEMLRCGIHVWRSNATHPKTELHTLKLFKDYEASVRVGVDKEILLRKRKLAMRALDALDTNAPQDVSLSLVSLS